MTEVLNGCNAVFIGQSGAWGLTSLGALRAPGWLPNGVAEFLFENNWAWWLGMLAVATAAGYGGRIRGNRAIQKAGAILGVVAVVWAAAALLVDTPRERLTAAHRAVLEAAERKDVAAIVARLSPGFRSEALHIVAAGDASKEIEGLLNKYGIRSNRILSLQTVEHDPDATTRVKVLTAVEGLGNVTTTWELDWRDMPGGDWVIGDARLIDLGGQKAPEGIPQ